MDDDTDDALGELIGINAQRDSDNDTNESDIGNTPHDNDEDGSHDHFATPLTDNERGYHIIMRLDLARMASNDSIIQLFVSCLMDIVNMKLVSRVGYSISRLRTCENIPGVKGVPVAMFLFMECTDRAKFTSMMHAMLRKVKHVTNITVVSNLFQSEVGSSTFVQCTGKWWIHDANQVWGERLRQFNIAMRAYEDASRDERGRKPTLDYNIWDYMLSGEHGPLRPREMSIEDINMFVLDAVKDICSAYGFVDAVETQSTMEIHIEATTVYDNSDGIVEAMNRTHTVIRNSIHELTSLTGVVNLPSRLLPKVYIYHNSIICLFY